MAVIKRTSNATGIRVRLILGGEVEFRGAVTEEFIRTLQGVMREPAPVR